MPATSGYCLPALALLATLWMFAAAPAAQAQAEDPAALHIGGVKIKVTDLGEALAFYRDALGFPVVSGPASPTTVTLDGTVLPLTLEQVTRPARAGFPELTQVSLSLQASDLHAAMARLKARGVVFMQDPPEPYGVNDQGVPLGLATKFEDPSGNVLSMVEQQRDPEEAFDGIRVYNAGYYLPDVEVGRAFYCGKLGFKSLTESYYPNIPVGRGDGPQYFMLHENEQARPVERAYPDEAQLVMVFTTGDLVAAMAALQAHGVVFLDEQPREGADGRYVAFRGPFGNVSELVERK
jgi:catechol 2,3-dioxygenase-like lactoylglutathione lyase family enzyme